MSPRPYRIVLCSRSPRRLELLSQIVPRGLVDVLPPPSGDEAGFEALHDWPAIEARLREIAEHKCAQGEEHWRTRTSGPVFAPKTAFLAADTVIVVREKEGRLVVLGQPPQDDTWADTVRRWFREYYQGAAHWAVTAVRVMTSSGAAAERVVRSEVTFIDDVERRLEWYLSTEEPRDKAGGYALQGAGSIFISRVEGSLSNVVGLPLAEVLELFDELEISFT